MPRNLNNVIGQALGDNYRQVIFVEIDFASAPVYLHSGFGEILFNGNYFMGVSAFGGISVRTEDTQMNPARLTLTLTGIDRRFIIEIQENLNYQNRNVYIWKAILDDNYQLVGTSGQLWYRGTTGNATITDQPSQNLQVTLDVNNFLAAWNRPPNLRYNNKAWQNLFPGDTIMQYVISSQGGKLWRGN